MLRPLSRSQDMRPASVGLPLSSRATLIEGITLRRKAFQNWDGRVPVTEHRAQRIRERLSRRTFSHSALAKLHRNGMSLAKRTSAIAQDRHSHSTKIS